MNTDCVNHLNAVCILFCKPCDQFVCLRCLEGNEHIGHEFLALSKLLQDRQERLQTIENKEMRLDSWASEEAHNISQRAETLHLNIDTRKAQLSEKLKQLLNGHKKQLSDMKPDLKKEISFLNKIMKASKSDAPSTENDEENVTDGAQCNFASSLVEMDNFEVPHFSFDNDPDVNKLFGRFENEDCDSGDADVEVDEVVKGLDDFSFGTEPVDESGNNFDIKENAYGMVRICPSSFRNSWITACGSKKITMFSNDGCNIKNISTRFRVFDIGFSQNQELFATEIRGHHVWKLSTNRSLNFRWTKFALLPEDFETTGIHINNSNHIWVCLQKEKFGGKVVKLSQAGEVSQEIEFNKKKERILKRPTLVHQNICTDDALIVDEGRIVVVDKLGVPIFEISGTSIQTVDKAVSSKNFEPIDLASDKEGNIITSDFGNKKVWIFDKEGIFIRSLCESDSRPTGLAFHSEEEVWVALFYGKITVIKYKQ